MAPNNMVSAAPEMQAASTIANRGIQLKKTIAPFSTVSNFADDVSQFSVIPYLLVFLLPIFNVMGMILGGGWHYFSLLFTFGLIPLLDLVFPSLELNPTPEQEKVLEQQLRYRVATLLYPVAHAGAILLGCYYVSVTDVTTIEVIGLILGLGVSSALGINVAHELGHKRTAIEPFFAKFTLMFTSYMHFQVEHIHGHHWNVATPNDPATAKKNQTFYNFWVQSVKGSYLSAWHLECQRLRKAEKSVVSLDNAMIWYTGLPIALYLAITATLGPLAGVVFAVQSFVGFSLLEVINYIEHYGLERVKLADGRWERVRPIHSWNANMKVTNYFLFKLQRHSDHHSYPYRRYQVLRSFDESPNLPTGYAGMSLLALFPSLWFRVMNPLVEEHSAKVKAIREQLNKEDMKAFANRE